MNSSLPEASATATKHNLASFLFDRQDRDAPFIHWVAGTITYRQITEQAQAARTLLREMGVSTGDRVAMALPNVPHMAVLYYATLAEGAIVVPMNPLLSGTELEHQVSLTEAKVLFTWAGTRVAQSVDALSDAEAQVIEIDAHYQFSTLAAEDDIAAVSLSDPAVIIFTSGTTGNPKGATLTHHNLTSNALACHEIFEYGPDDIFFGGLPLFHSFGQTVCLNAVSSMGCSVALLPAFSVDGAAELVASGKTNVFVGVPTMYAALIAYSKARPQLELKNKIRFGISGGAPLAPATHAAVEETLGFPIYEGYGLSETSPIVAFNQARFGLVVGSVGRAIPNVEVAVRDENNTDLPTGEAGQLWVRGENVMAGFWNNPEATEAVFDGAWFATGDVARLDEEGNIFIVDRVKDMILRNGYSVYPREIEDVIYQHPQVHMVAVVGEAKELVGEEVIAYIVPKDAEAENANLTKEVRALAKEHLASYKLPRHYRVVDELPLGPTGKILKRML